MGSRQLQLKREPGYRRRKTWQCAPDEHEYDPARKHDGLRPTLPARVSFQLSVPVQQTNAAAAVVQLLLPCVLLFEFHSARMDEHGARKFAHACSCSVPCSVGGGDVCAEPPHHP